MTPSWLAGAKAILDSPRSDLKSLAHAAGSDPKIFYIDQDLSKCDLRGEDLSGMDLTGTNLSPSQMDDNTKIDEDFDPRFVFNNEYVSFKVTLELFAIIQAFFNESSYIYRAWALKSLIENALVVQQIDNDVYHRFIQANDSFRNIVEQRKGRFHGIRLQLYKSWQHQIHDISYRRYGEKRDYIYAEMLFIGILVAKMPDIGRKDYSVISPMTLYTEAPELLKVIRKA